MKNYFAVSISTSNYIVSIVTHDYYKALSSEGLPFFYQKFHYSFFQSELTYSELNAMLPFSIEGPNYLKTINPECLSRQEILHWKTHLEILETYRKFQLAPLPPWHYTQTDNGFGRKLQELMGDLYQSACDEGVDKWNTF